MTVLTILFIPLAMANKGRAPAVEPFVEIDREVNLLNQKLGLKAAYNFKKENHTATNPNTGFDLSILLVILSFIALPFAGWNFVISRIEKNEHEHKVLEFKITSKYVEKAEEEDERKKAA